MEWFPALCLLFASLVFFMALSVPVAFSFFCANIIGSYIFLGGEIGLVQLVRNALSALATFSLAPIPLFILMGEVLFFTGLAFKAIDAVDRLIARLPGRLSVVSVISGTIFSSLSGSTIATTAMLGNTLLPEMLRRGYEPKIAMGPIMATGGIAMLIPPSALAVVLGSLAGLSISKLLIAGIVPGLMMSLIFLGYIVVRCYLRPQIAPAYDIQELSTWERWRPFLVHVLPLLSIFFIVVGSIVLGWATPTESAALGAVSSVAAAACYRSLSVKALVRSLMETARISVMILFIIAASVTFSQVLAISGAADGLLGAVQGMGAGPTQIIVGMLLILLFLGAFMEQVSIILITVPFYMPLAAQLQIDPIWLGVMMLIAIEIGLITPPFGLLHYVVMGVAPRYITLQQIYGAALPFIGLALVVLALVLLFPSLVIWLPALVQ